MAPILDDPGCVFQATSDSQCVSYNNYPKQGATAFDPFLKFGL